MSSPPNFQYPPRRGSRGPRIPLPPGPENIGSAGLPQRPATLPDLASATPPPIPLALPGSRGLQSSSSAYSDLPRFGRVATHWNTPANVNGQQGRMFSRSTPSLIHNFDGASSSREHANEANSSSDVNTQHFGPNHHYGVVASHFLSQPPNTYNGQTWVDFLRETGTDDIGGAHSNINGTTEVAQSNFSSQAGLPARQPLSSESSASSSVDRKRRLTTPESPVRRPSNTRMRSSTLPGDSFNDPIVVQSSPAPRRPLTLPARPSMTNVGRRDSEIVLPPWQPDSDVRQCPVCSNPFTWINRKHHCRKCGRVVCGTCSPHRITIPRQYIVRPPSETTAASIIDLTGDDDPNVMSAFGPFRNPHLGGGEVVRVCNPCVPDPNYSPPPQYSSNSSPERRFSSYCPPVDTSSGDPSTLLGRGPPTRHRSSHSDASQTMRPPRYPTGTRRDPFSDRRVSFHNSTRVADLWPPPLPHLRRPDFPGTIPPNMPPQGNHPASLYLSSDGAVPNPYAHLIDPQGRIQVPESTAQPQPRRQIAEEDECPICANELPPKGPDGSEDAREQHVQDCIAAHSSSASPPTASATTTSTSLPSPRTRGMSDATPGEGPSNRDSLPRSGMFRYEAMDGDTKTLDGGPVECGICLEDVEIGDAMGRLFCLCKYHEACLRQWWGKGDKGYGTCPEHEVRRRWTYTPGFFGGANQNWAVMIVDSFHNAFSDTGRKYIEPRTGYFVAGQVCGIMAVGGKGVIEDGSVRWDD
ncbi:FYVE-domain-containing protein [Zopfia rhizophila CBS 207.26]|uniref:RING-type E3 ubiquitin transferase n=1 Tax=Zopfia rhizophila CBS 207.26 TaxID=1314779 RepID=A0A6A6E3P2_9PEZI|nr:FYVE-domain-containing protein [Zopfia rhizophila CBS 207.26]